MAKTSRKTRSSGKTYDSKTPFLPLVVTMVILLGLIGYFLSQNNSAGYQTSAANIVQTVNGVLAKKGSAAYAECKGMKAGYVIVSKLYRTPTAKEASLHQTPAPTINCLVLSVTPSLADPLVGQNVKVVGNPQEGVLFVTSISKISAAK